MVTPFQFNPHTKHKTTLQALNVSDIKITQFKNQSVIVGKKRIKRYGSMKTPVSGHR